MIGDCSPCPIRPRAGAEEFVPLDPAALIRRQLEFLAPLAAASSVKTSLAGGGDPPSLWGTNGRWARPSAISSATGSSITAGGTLAITVEAADAMCVVRFEDSGIGIPDKESP